MKSQKSSLTNYYSTVDSLTRTRVLYDCKPLFQAPKKCRKIWEALQAADYKKQGFLNGVSLQLLLEREKSLLQELLMVKSVDEILDLLDQDEDGFLNEDEQILLFSVVKERMQKTAEKLCEVHEYGLFKEMMTAVRSLESDIVKYQQAFRKKIHEKELSTYNEIGIQKKSTFEEKWKDVFEQFEEECKKKIENIIKRHLEEESSLQRKLDTENYHLKVKPKLLLKQLYTQEKLLATNERYYEAQEIRHELEDAEEEEAKRVSFLIEQHQNNEWSKLKLKHQKELRQAEIKNQTEKNLLLVKQKRDKQRLLKEIKLYHHEIKKNQKLAEREGKKIATTFDDLRRMKLVSKKVSGVIAQSKSVMVRPEAKLQALNLPEKKSGVVSTLSATIGVQTNNELKPLVREAPRFALRTDIMESQPINIPATSFGYSSKNAKILSECKKTKSSLPSLSRLYNERLELIN